MVGQKRDPLPEGRRRIRTRDSYEEYGSSAPTVLPIELSCLLANLCKNSAIYVEVLELILEYVCPSKKMARDVHAHTYTTCSTLLKNENVAKNSSNENS
jgi:hypothetical protein